MTGYNTASAPSPMSRALPTTDATGASYFLHDANKNVMQRTDADGDLLEKYEYAPFGGNTGENRASIDFSSEAFDAATDLSYYNYRYYAPGLGRWTKRDPIEDVADNKYMFIGNNMYVFFDQLGLRRHVIFINMYYDFKTLINQNELLNMQKEYSRIVNTCIDSCDKCKKYTLVINWFSYQDELNIKLGIEKNNIATFVRLRVHNNPELLTIGVSAKGKCSSSINLTRIRDATNDDEIKLSTGEIIAQVIAHESLFHSLLNKDDYQSRDGNVYIDSDGGFLSAKPVREGLELSPRICKKLCKKIGIKQ